MTTDAEIGTFDFTEPDVQRNGIPHDVFAAARATAPVHWVEQPSAARAGFLGTGYWAVTKHADILGISKNSADFSTYENGAIIRFHDAMDRDQLDLQRLIPINQDDPEHAKHRSIVARAFTPRAVHALHDDLKVRGRAIVEEAKGIGSGNFVEQIAAELPLQAIANLLGVPQEDRSKLFGWTNAIMAYEDPEIDAKAANTEMFMYFMELAAERQANPRDDVVSKLVTAGPDGNVMSSDQFGFFVTLLVVAGNETTRNAITHGMNAFLDNPEQWELYKKERPATAVDEVVRWATPVVAFQRTALRDLHVGEQLVRSGDRVGLFYSSANYDEAVFENPRNFDILRSPNPHLSFGGHGAHYCIGANLARLEVGIMLDALADIVPNIWKTAEPQRARHSWVNGVNDLQVVYN